MLLDLPQSLVVDVISLWIKPQDIAYLDSAFCKKGARAIWLQILQTERVVLRPAYHQPSNILANQLKWYIKRNFKCEEFFISSNFLGVEMPIQAEFVASVGGDQVHTLELSHLTHNFSVLFGLVATNCKNLNNVVLSYCSSLLGAEVLFHLCRTNLLTINILNIAGWPIDESINWRALELRNLQELSIDGHYSAGFVQGALGCCPNLVRVRLYGTTVDDQCLHLLAQQAHRLDTLDFQNCTGYNPAAVVELAKQCSQLRHLEWRVPGAMDEEVSAFLTHCPLLQNLALLGVFTQAVMVAIAAHCGARLIHLELSFFQCTDDSGFEALGKHCTALETLQLNDLSGTSQDALARLVSAQTPWKCMATMDFTNMTVSNEVLAAVASHCPQLQRLYLYGAAGFSQMGLVGLIDGCRQLREVYIEENSPLISEFVREMWRRSNPEIDFLFEEQHPPCWQLDF